MSELFPDHLATVFRGNPRGDGPEELEYEVSRVIGELSGVVGDPLLPTTRGRPGAL